LCWLEALAIRKIAKASLFQHQNVRGGQKNLGVAHFVSLVLYFYQGQKKGDPKIA
jgi:hypothetical protein